MNEKDDLILSQILLVTSHYDLPNRLKKLITEEEYRNRVLLICVDRQLKHSKIGKLAVRDELKYYKLLEENCRNKMHLFPYHLQERLIGMHTTPFTYYLKMITENLAMEKSYDQLPNFTAADILRLTGIGRNQYITLLNDNRPKRSISRIIFGQSTRNQNLPSQINKLHLVDWWLLKPGFPTEQSILQLSKNGKTLLDSLIDEPAKSSLVKDNDIDVIYELYNAGLIYFDIPILPNDRFRVKILDGFVMNRLSGDYMETLIYRVFSTLSSSGSVTDLSELLNEAEETVSCALSALCRFGFIEKYIELDMDSVETVSDDILEGMSAFQLPSSNASSMGIALIYDSGLAALLMMGNLSAGLKKHAVLMFEVGRLEPCQIDSLIEELRNIDEGQCGAEGEAQTYFDQGRSLLLALELLRANSSTNMIKAESLAELPQDVVAKIMSSKYEKIISIAEIGCSIPVPRVPLVGNPGGIQQTPWTRLLLSKLNLSFGFSILVLPRGFRLKTMPETLNNKNFKKLKICSWNTNEFQLIDYSIGIYNINELLLNYPLMVYIPAATSIKVPLPTTREDLAKYITNKAILKEIERILDLKDIYGYIELMQINDTYVLESISFGLPLVSLSLTGAVCDAIISNPTSGEFDFNEWKNEINRICEDYGDVGDSTAWPIKPLLIEKGDFSDYIQ